MATGWACDRRLAWKDTPVPLPSKKDQQRTSTAEPTPHDRGQTQVRAPIPTALSCWHAGMGVLHSYLEGPDPPHLGTITQRFVVLPKGVQRRGNCCSQCLCLSVFPAEVTFSARAKKKLSIILAMGVAPIMCGEIPPGM